METRLPQNKSHTRCFSFALRPTRRSEVSVAPVSSPWKPRVENGLTPEAPSHTLVRFDEAPPPKFPNNTHPERTLEEARVSLAPSLGCVSVSRREAKRHIQTRLMTRC